MITLKTGLPRNGKTLSAVTELAALLAKWAKHPDQRRPVYQYGLTDLKLDATKIEAFPAGGQPGDEIPLTPNGKPACALAFDEFAIPDGALIIIDECQDFYPPRGPAQKAPAHVAALNTHGHRNIDYVLITQHPKLIDNGVRRLVNKHQHYRRAFGGKSAITYEWDACSDSLDYRSAIKGLFSYPKKSFKLYTSASGFTAPKFKLPAFLLVPLLAIPLAIWAGPRAYSAISGTMSGKGIGTSQPQAAAASSPTQIETARSARAGAAPATMAADASDAPQGRAASAPVAGCMATRARCLCLDAQGVALELPEAQCRHASVTLGGLIPYDVGHRPAPAGAASAPPTARAAAPGAGLHGIPSEGFGMMARKSYSVVTGVDGPPSAKPN